MEVGYKIAVSKIKIASTHSGLLPYMYVDRIDEAVTRGVVKEVEKEGIRIQAKCFELTIRRALCGTAVRVER